VIKKMRHPTLRVAHKCCAESAQVTRRRAGLRDPYRSTSISALLHSPS
jgi:hypothetical protein